MNAQPQMDAVGEVGLAVSEWQERMRVTSAPNMQADLVAEAQVAAARGDLAAALALACWQSSGKGGLPRDDLAALDALESLFAGPAGFRAMAYAAAVHQRLGSVDMARELAQASADAGDTDGMVVLGDSLSRDAAEALSAARWFRRAHDAGDITGTLRWARCLIHGKGVGVDVAQAESVLKRLTDDGIGEACFLMAELKGRTATDETQYREQRALWLSRAAADGYEPATLELAEVRNDQAWDNTRRFSLAGVALEGFIKTGVLRRISVDRRSTVVGYGSTVRTVHQETPVYELDCGGAGVERVFPKLVGQQAAAPGTTFRMLVVGRAGTLEGTCVSLSDTRGQRYSLIEVDELARAVGISVPKAGPATFWLMVMLAWTIFSWKYFPYTLVFAVVGAGLAGYFLKRNLSITSALWQHVQRLEDFWRGRPV